MNVLWCVTPSTSQLIFPQCPGLLFGVHVIFIHSVLTKEKIVVLSTVTLNEMTTSSTANLLHLN